MRQGLTLAERTVQNAIAAQGRAAGLTEAEIGPQLAQAALGEAAKDTLGDLAPLIAEEWGLDASISPTVAACLVLGPWAFASSTAYVTLAKLAKEKAAREISQATKAAKIPLP